MEITKQELLSIMSTIDLLATALVDHRHIWSNHQREKYEESIKFLRNKIKDEQGSN